MPSRAQDDAGIVVPLRSFALGKARLASVLDASGRAALARSMAGSVLDAAGSHPVAVVSSEAEVRDWARARGCDVLDDPGSLDGAASAGRDWAIERGLARYAIVHADLPLARSLDAVVADGDASVAVVVPDRHDDGNPVLALPTSTPFTFSYGPGSARRHAEEARRRSLTVRIVRDAELGFDVDVAADLDTLAALAASEHPPAPAPTP